MAQTIESSNYITIKVPLVRDSEEAIRTFNLPVPKELIGDVQTGFNTVIANYATGGSKASRINYLFQPTNWRDNDSSEEAWNCPDITKISYEVVDTTRTSGGYGD